MKWLLGIAAALLLAGPASAYELCLTIPTGDGLTRLGTLCDWLRADSTINKPAMTNKECGLRFFLKGAFSSNHKKKMGELRSGGKVLLQTEDDAFWADLPMPANNPPPTPVPTVTPTATPTTTPTSTPTATPIGD